MQIQPAKLNFNNNDSKLSLVILSVSLNHFLNHSLEPHLLHGVKWQHVFGDTKCHSHRHLFPAFTLPVVRDRATECTCDFHLFRLVNVSRGFSCCRRCCCLVAHPPAVTVFRLTVMLQMVGQICWATLLCCHLCFLQTLQIAHDCSTSDLA